MLPPAPPDVRRAAVGAYAGCVPSVRWGSGLAKRWHYAGVVGPRHAAAVAIVDLAWTTAAFAYVFDRRERRMLLDVSRMGLPLLSAHVTDRPSDGRSWFAGPGLAIDIERGRVRVHGVFAFELEPGPTLCAISPIPNCTHKNAGLRARGDFQGWGMLDHTIGLLDRDTRWRWAALAAEGIGLNLVEGFNGPVENAAWIGGEIVPLGDATITPGATWTIRARDVDLVFTPEGERREDRNFGWAKSRFVQPIGSFTGTILGRRIDGVLGVTEDHEARW